MGAGHGSEGLVSMVAPCIRAPVAWFCAHGSASVLGSRIRPPPPPPAEDCCRLGPGGKATRRWRFRETMALSFLAPGPPSETPFSTLFQSTC